MTMPLRHMQAECWLFALFASKAAVEGGVVRRAVRDVERLVGRDRFIAEIRRRGYAMVENSGQFVIFCNNAPLRRIC